MVDPPLPLPLELPYLQYPLSVVWTCEELRKILTSLNKIQDLDIKIETNS
jgi:uncharacterized protein YktA (UPF0223 family)